jgi:hypothetical protein
MDCTCPSCASGQSQRLAVIYADGTLRARGRSMQTAGSFLAAPPRPMSYVVPSMVIFLAFLILGAIGISKLPRNSWLVSSALGNTLQAAFVFVPVIAWMIRARRYNAITWRKRLGQWERSFRCSRCGEVFLVSHNR